MFRSDVPLAQALGFLGSVGENAFAFVAKRAVGRTGDLLFNSEPIFYLLADCFRRPLKTLREKVIFAEHAEKNMFGFNLSAACLQPNWEAW